MFIHGMKIAAASPTVPSLPIALDGLLLLDVSLFWQQVVEGFVMLAADKMVARRE